MLNEFLNRTKRLHQWLAEKFPFHFWERGRRIAGENDKNTHTEVIVWVKYMKKLFLLWLKFIYKRAFWMKWRRWWERTHTRRHTLNLIRHVSATLNEEWHQKYKTNRHQQQQLNERPVEPDYFTIFLQYCVKRMRTTSNDFIEIVVVVVFCVCLAKCLARACVWAWCLYKLSVWHTSAINKPRTIDSLCVWRWTSEKRLFFPFRLAYLVCSNTRCTNINHIGSNLSVSNQVLWMCVCMLSSLCVSHAVV